MDNIVRVRLNQIRRIAKQDAEWKRLWDAYLADRQKFLAYTCELPKEIGDFLLDYINIVADMKHRELIVACTELRLPGEAQTRKEK